METTKATRDGRAFFDVEAVDLFALRAGLMGDQSRAEDTRRFCLHVVNGFYHFDAAGLATPTGVNLRFHHPDRPAQLFGALDRLVDTHSRHPARHRHAEFAQHCFSLIFVDIHTRPSNVIGRRLAASR